MPGKVLGLQDLPVKAVTFQTKKATEQLLVPNVTGRQTRSSPEEAELTGLLGWMMVQFLMASARNHLTFCSCCAETALCCSSHRNKEGSRSKSHGSLPPNAPENSCKTNNPNLLRSLKPIWSFEQDTFQHGFSFASEHEPYENSLSVLFLWFLNKIIQFCGCP